MCVILHKVVLQLNNQNYIVMKIKADLAYAELKLRVQYKMVSFTDEPYQNFQLLDREMNTVNLAKCSLNDLEVETRGSSAYLAYLLQTNQKVPFGVCPKVKMWFNQAGFISVTPPRYGASTSGNVTLPSACW